MRGSRLSSEDKIPMQCRVCYYCVREEKYCSWGNTKDVPKLPFTETCEELKFNVLFLIDVLEALEDV